MKHSTTSAILAAIALQWVGCSKQQSLPGIPDSSQSVQTQSTGDAVNRVASDKELLRQALVLADTKGTLGSALTEAAQDSLVGIKMREALILGNEAKARATAPPKAGHTATNQGDALDKANRSLDKANSTIDKSGQTIGKARTAQQKIDDILNGKK